MISHPIGSAAIACVCASLLAAIGGCAPAPSLRSVLAERYPGYDQVLPPSTVNLAEKKFDYLPGNIGVFARQEPRTAREAAVWNNQGIYCSTNVPLSEYRPTPLIPVNVVHDFDFSLRRAVALQKAKANLRLEDNEIEFLRRITIQISSPRTFSLGRKQMAQYVQSCLTEIAGRPDLKKIQSIIVGNIRVSVLFKDNVSFLAKLSIYNKLQTSLGFGYVRGESIDLAADDVVFGAKLNPNVSIAMPRVAFVRSPR